MSTWLFEGLEPGRYGAILVDPPWSFRTWGGAHGTPHRCAEDHYRTMPFEDMAALPVESLARPDCALFMWVIDSHMPEALRLGEAWGFAYKTRAFECLLFTRGTPRRRGKGVRQVITAPRREHSRKPDALYGRVEALVDGPYAELFARTAWPGWDAWGNQVQRFSGAVPAAFRQDDLFGAAE